MRNMAFVPVLAIMLVIAFLVAACSSPAPAPAKPVEKPVESQAPAKAAEPKAAEKPAEAKPAEVKPVEKPAAAKPAEAKPAEAKPAEKPAAKVALPANISMGTSTVGNSYHTVGAGLAKVASDHTPIKVMVKPFAGPNAWMPMIESGELDLGVLSGIDAGWAYAGTESFPTASKNLRILMQGNNIPVTGFTVRNDSDIKTIKDVRGKRVSSDYAGHAVIKNIMTSYLESAGLTWNDVRSVPVTDYANGLKAIREGRSDVSFGGSTDTAAALETDAAIGIRLLNFADMSPDQAAKAPKEVLDKLQKRVPGAVTFNLKKEGWLKSDAAAIQYPIFLGAGVKLSEDAAYEITKAVYTYDTELHPVSGWLKDWKQKTMFEASAPAPYHDGAIRFWKEKGLWTADAEANQKRLLGR